MGNVEAELAKITFGKDEIAVDALDFFFIESDDDEREVMLVVFRSPLGSELQNRKLSEAELSDLRETVSLCKAFAMTTKAGIPDDYFIEFAHGDAKYFGEIAPEFRSVFGFESGNWQHEQPVKIHVSE